MTGQRPLCARCGSSDLDQARFPYALDCRACGAAWDCITGWHIAPWDNVHRLTRRRERRR